MRKRARGDGKTLSTLSSGNVEGKHQPTRFFIMGVRPKSRRESGLSAHVLNFCAALKDLSISIL